MSASSPRGRYRPCPIVPAVCLVAAIGCEGIAGLGDFEDGPTSTGTASATGQGGGATGTATGSGTGSAVGGSGTGGTTGGGGPGGGTPSGSVSVNCGFSSPATPIFRTTLDDLDAVLDPAQGSGLNATVVTTPANDFVPTACGGGIRLDASPEVVTFPPQVVLAQGTIAFRYTPSSDTTQGGDKQLFVSSTAPAASKVRIYFRVSGNVGLIVRLENPNTGSASDTVVSTAASTFDAGDTVSIRVTWDAGVAANVQHAHVYLDGVEPAYVSAPTGPLSLSASGVTAPMRIGNFDPTLPGAADGVIDEFRIYDQVLPP